MQSPTCHQQSTALLRRKVMKPLMEKRRRARINNCLSELKRFLMAYDGGTFEKQSSRSQRIEKADILEMTVKFLRQRRFPLEADSHEGAERMQRFHEGYQHCVFEVTRYVSATDPRLRDTLLTHLQARLHHLATTTTGGRVQPGFPDEAVSSTNSEAQERADSCTVRLPECGGYETGSLSDASDEDSSSSDCGDGGSMDADLCLRSRREDEPQDYRLHRDQEMEQDGSNEPMWRPW